MQEEKLFGSPKYEVESLADAVTRVNAEKKGNTKLYGAVLKLLAKRQQAISSALKSR